MQRTPRLKIITAMLAGATSACLVTSGAPTSQAAPVADNVSRLLFLLPAMATGRAARTRRIVAEEQRSRLEKLVWIAEEREDMYTQLYEAGYGSIEQVNIMQQRRVVAETALLENDSEVQAELATESALASLSAMLREPGGNLDLEAVLTDYVGMLAARCKHLDSRLQTAAEEYDLAVQVYDRLEGLYDDDVITYEELIQYDGKQAAAEAELAGVTRARDACWNDLPSVDDLRGASVM